MLGNRHNLALSNSQENGVQMTVKKINVHPKYDGDKVINDIAIWQLSGGDSLKQFVKLNDAPDLKDFSSATAIGWGTISNDGPLSNTLQTVNLPLVQLATCRKQLGTSLPATVFCAGGQGGQDTCAGDSGGPLFVESNGVQTMLGLTSWGDKCATKGKPGVYTRISSFKSWIESFIITSAVSAPVTAAAPVIGTSSAVSGTSSSPVPGSQIPILASIPTKPSVTPSKQTSNPTKNRVGSRGTLEIGFFTYQPKH